MHITEVERLKADLHAAGFERERLHAERIKVIAELYRRLVRAERTLDDVAAAQLIMIGEEDEDSKPTAELREALDASDSFQRFFDENRIYFDEAVYGYRHADKTLWCTLEAARTTRIDTQ